MSTPGLLYVTMQPKPGLSLSRFHEWYNNEHGPARLRLPHIFSTGLRFRAVDGQSPEFLALYDVTAMSHLETETYTTLRANRSPREAETIAQVDVDRRFYTLVHATASLDQLSEGLTTIAVEVTIAADDAGAAEHQRWWVEEHLALISKTPGWLRSRLFKLSSPEANSGANFLALHDHTGGDGQGQAHELAMKTAPYRAAVRTYSLFYVFGPAPRDLQSLAGDASSFVSPDGRTVTTAGPDAAISSYVSIADAVTIPYRLEGNPSPAAPCIALSNSLLTSLHMWDPLITLLKHHRPDLRILRYDFRGRHAIPPSCPPATLDVVTSDLAALLDALRIPKLHALIGVSMGGVTTVNFALTQPQRIDRFIACDFNCASKPANTQAWKDRIALAHEDGGRGIHTLARQTVSRWFHPNTMDKKPETVRWMTDMVGGNDVDGFGKSCTVLWDYDLRPAMPSCSVPGLLVVGSHDGNGAVVDAMQAFKTLLGRNSTELRVVPDTGHLPMCEDPEAFWRSIKDFLEIRSPQPTRN